MNLNTRRAALVAAAALMALSGMAVAVGAQEQASVHVAGSATAAALVESVAAEAEITLDLSTTGTAAGISALCANAADVALSTRAMSAEEEAICAAAGVSFYELLLGHTAAAIIVNSAGPAPECLDSAQLTSVFAPSAAGQTATWSQVVAGAAADDLTVFAPGLDSVPVALLDAAVEGDGLSADITSVANDAEVIAAVAAAPGAIGVVDFVSTNDLPEGLKVVQLDTTAAGCTAPSAAAFESRSYGIMWPLYAYVNASTAGTFAEALAASGETATAAGFTAPSESAAAQNAATLTNSTTGRVFSRYVTEFTIPEGANGSVLAAGSSAGRSLIANLGTAITTEFPSLIITPTLLGQQAGIDSLCSGASDLAFITGDADPSQWTACTERSVEPTVIPLGGRPVVLVAHESDPYLTCLTMEQVAATFTTDATSWDQVDPAFPAQPVTLVSPELGSGLKDLLASLSAGPAALLRTDMVLDSDPLFRAAAVANVEGGLTFMDWSEYLRVEQSGQAGIQLVAVNGGSECVLPSQAAFEAGTYPLSEPLQLLVSPAGLAKPAVQSVVWYLLMDRNFNLFAQSDLFGLAFQNLATQRFALQDAFVAAELAAAEAAAAEATPEATAEVASETTPEAEVTPEATAAS